MAEKNISKNNAAKEFFKSTGFKSVAVLLCIAVVCVGLLAILNPLLYVQTGGLSDFDGLVEGASFEDLTKEINAEFTSDAGTLSTLAKTSDGKYYGFIAVGKASGHPKDFTVLAVIETAGNTIYKVKVLESGATGSDYAIDEKISAFEGKEVAVPDALDNVDMKTITAGATESGNSFKNAMKVVANYYATYILGASDPSQDILEILNGKETGVTYEKADKYDYTKEGFEIKYHFTSSVDKQAAFAAEVTVKEIFTDSGRAEALDTPVKVNAVVIYSETASAGKVKDIILLDDGAPDISEYLTKRVIGKIQSNLNSSATKKETDTAEKAAARLIGLDVTSTKGYPQAGTGKYFAMFAQLSEAAFTKIDLNSDVALSKGSVLFAASANDSTHGEVVALAIEANGESVNGGGPGNITMAVLISRTTNKIVSVNYVSALSTSGWENCIPSDADLQKYLNVEIVSDTVFDTFVADNNIHTGATAGGSASALTINNGFVTAAQYYAGAKLSYLTVTAENGKEITYSVVGVSVVPGMPNNYLLTVTVENGAVKSVAVVTDGATGGFGDKTLNFAEVFNGKTLSDIDLISLITGATNSNTTVKNAVALCLGHYASHYAG